MNLWRRVVRGKRNKILIYPPDYVCAMNTQPARNEATSMSIKADILAVVRRELDDVERYIKAGNKTQALNELDDAVRKLKKIADRVD